jgi:anti-sigma B factor antagonist
MTVRIRSVEVKQLPATLNKAFGRLFLAEVEGCLKVDHPRIVFDCSELTQLDKPGVRVLLTCLEEAMKRRGDVKLTGIAAKVMTMLELTGVSRLFEIFDTNAEAVNSFRRHPLHAAPDLDATDSSHRNFENAT